MTKHDRERAQVSMRLPVELLTTIDAIAEGERRTRTQVIELLLELGLAGRASSSARAPLELADLRDRGRELAGALELVAKDLRRHVEGKSGL